LVDLHCHLLAGLDDGPRCSEEALEMCRIARAEGVGLACATAHQNERWPDVTPERIRQATQRLAENLLNERVSLTVFPCAEVMVHPGFLADWSAGQFLSVADRGRYLLIEMPNQLYVDLRESVMRLTQMGVRPILAHPERHAELLHEPDQIEQLIEAGCLVQVSSASITDPPDRACTRALKSWLKRGIVHFIGSDGHSPFRRPPLLREAYRTIEHWAGQPVADRVCSTNGLAVLHGLPLRIPRPKPRPARRLLNLW
jgi:protein-tyrosine phosphatase